MNTDGLVLVLITLFMVIAMIICNKWIRKVTNSYFFWAPIGLFFFIWLLVFRFVPDWQNYIAHMQAGGFDDPSTSSNSLIISRAFLLDACPFFALATCAVCFLDPSRKIARTIAPIALVGGIITIGALPFDASSWTAPSLTAQYIFFGDDLNKCYFIMHWLQIIIPVGILLNTPRFGWKGWLWTLAAAITYYSYVAIVAYGITGCRWYISGLYYNDWSEQGEYFVVHHIFDFIPLEALPFVGVPALFVFASIFVVLKDYIFSKWHWHYGNAFSGKWYAWYNYNKDVKQIVI